MARECFDIRAERRLCENKHVKTNPSTKTRARHSKKTIHFGLLYMPTNTGSKMEENSNKSNETQVPASLQL